MERVGTRKSDSVCAWSLMLRARLVEDEVQGDQEGGLQDDDGDADGDGVAARDDRQSPSALISSTTTLSTRAPLIVRSERLWAAS
jgi:hypothetical protein